MHLEPGRLGLECFVNVFICLTKVHIEKTIVMVNVNQIYMIVINVLSAFIVKTGYFVSYVGNNNPTVAPSA